MLLYDKMLFFILLVTCSHPLSPSAYASSRSENLSLKKRKLAFWNKNILPVCKCKPVLIASDLYKIVRRSFILKDNCTLQTGWHCIHHWACWMCSHCCISKCKRVCVHTKCLYTKHHSNARKPAPLSSFYYLKVHLHFVSPYEKC